MIIISPIAAQHTGHNARTRAVTTYNRSPAVCVGLDPKRKTQNYYILPITPVSIRLLYVRRKKTGKRDEDGRVGTL